MTSYILDINRCSIYDGPGLRTSIFLKGCPLKCKWCHNPESQSFLPELRYMEAKCIDCRQCALACTQGVHQFISQEGKLQHKVEHGQCIQCGACIKVCPTGALEQVGKAMTVEEVMKIVKEDLPFYKKSKGGVTLSGGEPLSHPDFVLEILEACGQAGIHRCVETSGFGKRENLERIVDQVDLFLLDYKITGEAAHLAYTGVSPKLIHENMNFLREKGKKVILRCPIIPGINDTEAHFDGIIQMGEHYTNIESIELLPYHKLGVSKALQVGMGQETFREPTKEEKQKWLTYCQAKGCSNIQINL